MSMAWIDYRKTLDSVPHNQIIKSLELFKVSPILVNFLKSNMNNWKTALFLYINLEILNLTLQILNAVFFKEIPYLLYFFVLLSFL